MRLGRSIFQPVSGGKWKCGRNVADIRRQLGFSRPPITIATVRFSGHEAHKRHDFVAIILANLHKVGIQNTRELDARSSRRLRAVKRGQKRDSQNYLSGEATLPTCIKPL
jgi:hypothetical protein